MAVAHARRDMRRLLLLLAFALPGSALAAPLAECPVETEPGIAAIGRAVADARSIERAGGERGGEASESISPFGFDEYNRILKEVFGEDAVLRDKPNGKLPGHVDAGDTFEYVKDGRRVKTTLGKTRFEQARMNAHVVKAAREMAASGADFSGRSADDRANKDLWWMGYGGKLGVRQNVKSSDAIKDVFENGDKYAFECATGNLLVYYKAILDRIGPEDFDREFPKLRLFRWDIKDDDLLAAEKTGKFKDHWPGDHNYFSNPDFAPEHSAWQGENTIYLGGGEYFGHGIGIESGDSILSTLNSLRKEGARKKAYLNPSAVRLDGSVIAKLDQEPD